LLSGNGPEKPGITTFSLPPGKYNLQAIDPWGKKCPQEAGLSTGRALDDFEILSGETRVIDLSKFK
jgi:hypothetical protein